MMTLLLLALALTGEAETEHPPLMSHVDECERWVGTASGNDPTVRLQLRLCQEGDGVAGHVQWSSRRSGWNVRRVRGARRRHPGGFLARRGGQVTLRDEALEVSRPNPGWRFCTIDRWQLREDGDSLVGRYDSAGCDDHAEVRLRRMRADEGPAGGHAADPVSVRRARDETSGGLFGCTAIPAGPIGLSWLGPLLLVVVARARRR